VSIASLLNNDKRVAGEDGEGQIATKVGIKRVVEKEGPTNGERWATSVPPVSKGGN
jgi:hypothetical protein